MKKMIFKQVLHKEKLILEYQQLLEESKNDEQTMLKINNLIKYFEVYDIDPLMVKQHGFLRTIYLLYKYDKNIYITKLKSASKEERKQIETTIESYNLFLTETLQLMKEEELIKKRQLRMQKIEKLIPEEIALIKEKYIQSVDDESKKI